jgi:hypothetical protein
MRGLSTWDCTPRASLNEIEKEKRERALIREESDSSDI